MLVIVKLIRLLRWRTLSLLPGPVLLLTYLIWILKSKLCVLSSLADVPLLVKAIQSVELFRLRVFL